MKTWIKHLIDLFYPPLCVVCGSRLVDGERCVCISCLSQIPKTNYHKQKDNRLEVFFAGRIPYEGIASLAYFYQEGSIQKIIHELKYKDNPEIGVLMGELYGTDLKGSDFIKTIDFIVPVPLHPKRERTRGYNQSLEIAKGLSKHTGISIDSTTLVRTVNNISQTKNSGFDRWKNVEDIFTLTNQEEFEGKHILLVDDVITTGSTLESCAREVLKSQNCKISIVAIGVAT